MIPNAKLPWHSLTPFEAPVALAAVDAVEATCPRGSRLYRPVARIVQQARDSDRMFPLAVLGALTGDPEPAIPVAVVSTVWWAGAGALDNLSDTRAGTRRASPGLTLAESLMGAVACLELIPRRLIECCPAPADVRGTWSEELIAASVAAANGRLADAARDTDAALSWAQVMAMYVGKTGAAYARDAVMAARLATRDTTSIGAWRAFGQLFGVLRQMHNDNAPVTPDDDEDLANGTPTLLMAHALETATPARKAELLGLRAAAMHDLESRAALRHQLHEPDIASGYTGKLHAAYHLAGSLLESIAGPSVCRDALRTRMDSTVRLASPQPSEARQP